MEKPKFLKANISKCGYKAFLCNDDKSLQIDNKNPQYCGKPRELVYGYIKTINIPSKGHKFDVFSVIGNADENRISNVYMTKDLDDLEVMIRLNVDSYSLTSFFWFKNQKEIMSAWNYDSEYKEVINSMLVEMTTKKNERLFINDKKNVVNKKIEFIMDGFIQDPSSIFNEVLDFANGHGGLDVFKQKTRFPHNESEIQEAKETEFGVGINFADGLPSICFYSNLQWFKMEDESFDFKPLKEWLAYSILKKSTNSSYEAQIFDFLGITKTKVVEDFAYECEIISTSLLRLKKTASVYNIFESKNPIDFSVLEVFHKKDNMDKKTVLMDTKYQLDLNFEDYYRLEKVEKIPTFIREWTTNDSHSYTVYYDSNDRRQHSYTMINHKKVGIPHQSFFDLLGMTVEDCYELLNEKIKLVQKLQNEVSRKRFESVEVLVSKLDEINQKCKPTK